MNDPDLSLSHASPSPRSIVRRGTGSSRTRLQVKMRHVRVEDGHVAGVARLVAPAVGATHEHAECAAVTRTAILGRAMDRQAVVRDGVAGLEREPVSYTHLRAHETPEH